MNQYSTVGSLGKWKNFLLLMALAGKDKPRCHTYFINSTFISSGQHIPSEPFIERSWREQFLSVLNEEVKNRGGLPIRHNATPDHVHLLVRMRPTTLISEFICQIKGATSFRVNKEMKPRFKLSWQEGYGVVSLRREECEKVSLYIDRQEAHH